MISQTCFHYNVTCLKFLRKTKKMFGFYWHYIYWHCLPNLGGFEWFLIFLILFNPANPGKIEKHDF